MRRNPIPSSAVGLALLASAAAVVPALTRDLYHIDVATRILEAFMLTMSLRLVLNLGLLNLAHVSFMALGAYGSAALVMKAGLSFWLALPTACVIAAGAASALGGLTLRLRGPYFFLVTFALLVIVQLFFHSFFEDLFGGASGLIGIPRPGPLRLGGHVIPFEGKVALYYLALALWVLAAAALVRFEYSRLGALCAAIRQSESLARAVGIRTVDYKVVTLAMAGLVAGAAGAFYAHARGVVNATDFGIEPMLRLLVFVVVGGPTSVWGPIVGTLVLSLVSEVLRDLRRLETLVYGAVLIVTMRFFSEGLIGGVQRLTTAVAALALRLLRRARYDVA